MVYWKSSGTLETGAWVYWAWLAWLGGSIWVLWQALQGVLSGWFSYALTLGLATSAGLLSVPLLNRVSVVNLLILVPVWMFGAWYSLLSLTLPSLLFFMPLLAYSSGLIVGALTPEVWKWITRKRPSSPA